MKTPDPDHLNANLNFPRMGKGKMEGKPITTNMYRKALKGLAKIDIRPKIGPKHQIFTVEGDVILQGRPDAIRIVLEKLGLNYPVSLGSLLNPGKAKKVDRIIKKSVK